MSPTLTPTHANGTTAQPTPMVYVPPERQMTPDRIDESMEDLGINAPFVADLLSAMLAHERCGRHLYRSVAGRSHNPMLKSKYEEFGKETERHVELLETLIAEMGGDPQYVSPAARATEAKDTKLVESTFLLNGSVDIMTRELVMLEAVLLAETIDHNNWSSLAEMVQDLPEGEIRDSAARIVGEVEAQEDDHLEWARSTRSRLIRMQASSSAMQKAGAKAEEMVATVRNWFGD